MNSINRQNLVSVFIVALIGSFVTLLLSPFMITLGFLLNDHLARPILSIEYVEIVPEEKRFPTPTTELTSFIQSNGYQTVLRKGLYHPSNNPMLYLNYTDGLETKDVNSLQDGVNQYITIIGKQKTQLKKYQNTLLGNPTEEEIRDIAMSYSGPFAQFIPLEKDIKILNNTLLAKIRNETKIIEESRLLAISLTKKLDADSSDAIGKINLKLSILNKGNTDGLVRSVGEIYFLDNNLKVPIKSTSAPHSPKGFLNAVRVSVVDPPSAPQRYTSVGKVDKHSLIEFWYTVDNLKASREQLLTLETIIGQKDILNFGMSQLKVALFS